MPDAQFLVTRDNSAFGPRSARQLVRGSGPEDLKAAVRDATQNVNRLATYDRATRTVTLGPDVVLLMIGTTSELDAALQRACTGPDAILLIETGVAREPLTKYFARISVSLVQTDTIVALAHATNWNARVPNTTAQNWIVPAGDAQSTYVSLNTRGTRCLVDIVESGQGVKGISKT